MPLVPGVTSVAKEKETPGHDVHGNDNGNGNGNGYALVYA